MTLTGIALSALGGAALYVHLRGRVRHRPLRQLTDHSTFFAPYNVLMYLFSAVPRTPFLRFEDFPELAPLRTQWTTIRDEMLTLQAGANLRPALAYNDIAFNTFFRRGWKRFYLKWYDDPLPSARALCPRTVALVESIPQVNAALFALLPVGARLGEHRDPFAGSLRLHLGLDTPNSDACRIYVDGQPYSWRDGEAVVFDETYIHSAVNESDRDRIILFCDVARPLRTGVLRALNRWVTRHVVKATATQNEATEHVGVVNRAAGRVHALGLASRRMKKRLGRPTYYTLKYALLAAGAGVLAYSLR